LLLLLLLVHAPIAYIVGARGAKKYLKKQFVAVYFDEESSKSTDSLGAAINSI
jgi:hypothetical protein